MVQIYQTAVKCRKQFEGFELAKLDGETLSKIDLTKESPNRQYVDDNLWF